MIEQDLISGPSYGMILNYVKHHSQRELLKLENKGWDPKFVMRRDQLTYLLKNAAFAMFEESAGKK